MPLKKINDYPAYLEQAWQGHLKRKPKNAPTVISLFAGCGGSSLGYSMARFRELLAVEWDDHAVETFKMNFPDVPVIKGDIVKVSVEQILEVTGLKVGELDILDGSPPCQGFSMAGKRQLDDPRNQLFREYVRLLRGLKPKVFIMENVSGMVKGVMKLVFVEILKELKASGYKVSARLLNAMYFGVPQSRERMIFVGAREDLRIEPTHPKAENRPLTVKQAWGYDDGIGGSGHGQLKIKTFLPAPEITGKAAEIGFLLQPGQRGSDIVKGWQDTVRLELNKPSRVVLKEAALWKRYPKMIHPKENRGISIGELKRLSSFPDSYGFTGKWVDAWARIGNSVPPLFMRSIAKHVKTEILDKVKGV